MRGVLLLALALSGCTHSIHQVYSSGFTPYTAFGGGNLIRGQSEQFVVLGFVFDTDYVEKARRNLMDQCRSGYIKGITTQYSTSHGFFSWTNKILMQGLCIEKDNGA